MLASMCHAMPFSARALKKKKKNIFFDVDIVVKNKSTLSRATPSQLLKLPNTFMNDLDVLLTRDLSEFFNPIGPPAAQSG